MPPRLAILEPKIKALPRHPDGDRAHAAPAVEPRMKSVESGGLWRELDEGKRRGEQGATAIGQLNHPDWIIARRSSTHRANSRFTIGQSLPHGVARTSRMRRLRR